MFWTTVRSFEGVGMRWRGALRTVAAKEVVVLALVSALGCGGTAPRPNTDSGNTSGSSSSGAPGSSNSASTSASPDATGASSGQSTAPVLMGPDVFPHGVTKPKIMIVGDSISAGPGCYKGYLQLNLQNSGITNFEFVGKYEDACGGGVRHSAVSCTTTAQYAAETFTVDKGCKQKDQEDITDFPGMALLAEEFEPDMVMLQLGVNDVWNGNVDIQPILANYEKLVAQARAANSRVVVVVAQIHKVITIDCPDDKKGPVNASAQELIEALPVWAASVSTDDSPVLTADLWTNSDPSQSNDCVHPNTAGAKQMAGNWFESIKGILTFP